MELPKLALDLLAWLFNIVISVTLIAVNKQLMNNKFSFATSLTALHFVATAGIGFFSKRDETKVVPMKKLLWFSVAANLSIVFMNLSLLYNSIGFYQISKLSLMPVVCILEYLINGKTYSLKIILAVAAVFVGLATVTVTDVSVTFAGLLVAGIAVLSTGIQQISIGSLQKQHGVSSLQLLGTTAPIQASWLLPIAPFVDKLLVNRWVFTFEYRLPAVCLIGGSCLLAVCCNLSQYIVIRRFSATSFQVVGHVKTFLVIAVGCLFFGEVLTKKMALGVALALLGIVAYGWVSNSPPSPAPPPKVVVAPNFDDEDVVLLKSGVEYTPEKDVEMATEVKQSP